MKLMVASDIHGSAYYCKMLLDSFEKENPDKLILLGDILYHGPRNDLPKEYAPKQVIEMLNNHKNKIMCVKGNCDAQVDQMVLDFPILSDYAVIFDGCHLLYATHGHTYNELTPPPISNNEILLCGHTHVPKIIEKEGFVYMNVGSVSIPKENSPHSYMIIENGEFQWKNLIDGNVYMVK